MIFNKFRTPSSSIAVRWVGWSRHTHSNLKNSPFFGEWNLQKSTHQWTMFRCMISERTRSTNCRRDSYAIHNSRLRNDLWLFEISYKNSGKVDHSRIIASHRVIFFRRYIHSAKPKMFSFAMQEWLSTNWALISKQVCWDNCNRQHKQFAWLNIEFKGQFVDRPLIQSTSGRRLHFIVKRLCGSFHS